MRSVLIITSNAISGLIRIYIERDIPITTHREIGDTQQGATFSHVLYFDVLTRVYLGILRQQVRPLAKGLALYL